MVPQDLKYTKTHEWARLDSASGMVTVGITDFAVAQLGDIVFLELPAVGAAVRQDAPFGVIESVKAAVDLNAPVGGQVAESNQALTSDFDSLTKDPYGRAWMIRIKPSSSKELESLMSPQQYEQYAKSEQH